MISYVGTLFKVWFYRIPVYSEFDLDRYHYVIILSFFSVKLSSTFTKKYKSDELEVLKCFRPVCLVGHKLYCFCDQTPMGINL
jgi:hypothetical protein